MRNIVAERLELGWTEQQIKAYFVEAYGPSVLLEPSSQGSNLLVWLVPPLGIALALVALIVVLRQMRAQPPQSVEPPLRAHLSEGESEEYLNRAQAALAYEGLEAPQNNPDAASGPDRKKRSPLDS
jgi:cytochrome c-type biogenesis protein CcmH/NrfF